MSNVTWVRLLRRRWHVRSVDIALVVKLVLVRRIRVWVTMLVWVRSRMYLLRRPVVAWGRQVCINIVVGWAVHVDVVFRGC